MISTKELSLRAYKRSINEEDKILPRTEDCPFYKKKICKPYIPRNVEVNTRYGEMKIKHKGEDF
jgi:hypothetical protein